jgi:6-phosphogluconolactonase (cycloisomerase 2 family)
MASIAPTSANAGGPDFTLTVNGGSFISTSTVNWNGSARATTEVSDKQLTAAISAADIAAGGTAQITVVNPSPGGGTSNSLDFTITAAGATATPAFLYIVNAIGVSLTEGNISVYSVDPDTGSLTPVSGSPFAGAPEPTALAVDPSSKFLYIDSGIDNLTPAPVISAFSLDPSTGAPSPVPGSPFVSGAVAVSLAVDSTGKFLYSVDDTGTSNSISEFSIDASSGALTPITQTECEETTNQGGSANAVAADPVAGFLFAAEVLDSVCSYSIDSQGVLQQVPGSPFSVGTLTSPVAIVADPFGKFIYIADRLSQNLSAFSITSGSGTLSLVPGSPFAPGSDLGPNVLAMDPLGRFLFVQNFAVGIQTFSIDPTTGAITLLPGPPQPSRVPLTPPAIDPSGKFLYFVSQNASGNGMGLSAFAIDASTGALTPIAGSPFALPASAGSPVVLTVTRKSQ